MDPIEEYYTSILYPKKYERLNYGEVFTNQKLINKMLDLLPKEFWSNPENKILDPASGQGQFGYQIYKRLMKQHNQVNKKTHKKVLNQIEQVELNPENVKKIKEIFGEDVNVKEADFLELPIQEKYDLIVGNPPYQDASGNKGRGHILWIPFVEKSLELLKENGYLLFLHPSNWRQVGHPLYEKMSHNQIHFIDIYDINDGSKWFNSRTRFDIYLLQKKPYTKPTRIISENDKEYSIDLREWKFLPNSFYPEIKQLLAKSNDRCVNIGYDRSAYGADMSFIKKEANHEYKYPVIYSINVKNDIHKRYSNTNQRGHFGIPKFIFSNGLGHIVDDTGKYGMTQWCYAIYDDKKNLTKIKKCFENPEFRKLMQTLRVDSSNYNTKVMQLFKKDFYKYFS